MIHIANWRVTEIGRGRAAEAPDALLLVVDPTPEGVYSDAQISDYHPSDFRWRPPLRLTVRASATPVAEELRGTAGFGFWNQPFMPGQYRLRLPQAVWFFFSSPPSNMALAQGVPGPGWKAATVDARRWSFFTLLPLALPGFLLMRVPALCRRLWPTGQRAIGVSEHLLDSALLAEMHTYTLEWHREYVIFEVDGEVLHRAPSAPGGPLGFVAWVDNQYAVVTPQGHFGAGIIPLAQQQTLRLEHIQIERL